MARSSRDSRRCCRYMSAAPRPTNKHSIMLFKTLNIRGKDVYVVESHHHVLQPWANIRKSMATAPVLLTLDYHTDTDEPFNRYRNNATSSLTGKKKAAAMDAMLPALISRLRFDDEASLHNAILDLDNDEHIHTAIQTGIVSRAFIVNLSCSTYSERGVLYETGSFCGIGCAKTSHDDGCRSFHSAQVLESIYLDHELAVLNGLAAQDGVPKLEAGPYILDIDLDYFRSEKAIAPDDPTTFHRLVRNAVAVTLATEPDYVEELRDEGSKITAEMLLETMIERISEAVA